MKEAKGIHEVFLFYTPQLMHTYFAHLKNKIHKVSGVTTLLVLGSDLVNVHSESYMLDKNVFKSLPNLSVAIQGNSKTLEKSESIKPAVDSLKQSKIKSFHKKAKRTSKACLINKKAS